MSCYYLRGGKATDGCRPTRACWTEACGAAGIARPPGAVAPAIPVRVTWKTRVCGVCGRGPDGVSGNPLRCFDDASHEEVATDLFACGSDSFERLPEEVNGPTRRAAVAAALGLDAPGAGEGPLNDAAAGSLAPPQRDGNKAPLERPASPPPAPARRQLALFESIQIPKLDDE